MGEELSIKDVEEYEKRKKGSPTKKDRDKNTRKRSKKRGENKKKKDKKKQKKTIN